jgi:hypothetical protein
VRRARRWSWRVARGSCCGLLLLLLLAALAPPAVAVEAEPRSDEVEQGGPCDAVSLPLRPACTIAGGLQGVPDLLGASVGGLAGSAGDAAMQALTGFVVDGAVWFVSQVGELVGESTAVSVQADWFTRSYNRMVALAAVVALALLLFSAASTMLHRDPQRLLQAVGMAAAAGVGTGMVTGIVAVLLEVSDVLAAQLAQGLQADLDAALGGLTTSLSNLSSPAGGPDAVPLLAVLLAALLAVVGAFAVWLELLLREGAIYATVLFYPLALAGTAWSGSRAWARRLAKAILALIAAKVVIVAMLALAAAGLASPASDDPAAGYGGVLAGSVLLLLAAFSPFVLIRLAASFDDGVDQANDMRGMRQHGVAPVQSAAARASHSLRASGGGQGGGGLRVAPGASAAGSGGASAAGAGLATAAARAPAAAGRRAGQRLEPQAAAAGGGRS